MTSQDSNQNNQMTSEQIEQKDNSHNEKAMEIKGLLNQLYWLNNKNNKDKDREDRLKEIKDNLKKLLDGFDYEKINKFSSPFYNFGCNINLLDQESVELFLNNQNLKIDYVSLFAGVFSSYEKIELIINYLEKYNKLNLIDEKSYGQIVSYNLYKNNQNSYYYSAMAKANENKEKILNLFLEKTQYDNIKLVFKLYNFIFFTKNLQNQSHYGFLKQDEEKKLENIRLRKDLYAQILEYTDLMLDRGCDANYKFGNYDRHIFYEFAKYFDENEENINFLNNLFNIYKKYNFDPNVFDETYKNSLFQSISYYKKFNFLQKFLDCFAEKIDYEHKNTKGTNLLLSFLKAIKNDFYINRNPTSLNPKEQELQSLVKNILLTMFKKIDFDARGGKLGRGKKFIDHIKSRGQKGSIFFQTLYEEIMIENAISKKVNFEEKPKSVKTIKI